MMYIYAPVRPRRPGGGFGDTPESFRGMLRVNEF
jgi:hypothetical protein